MFILTIRQVAASLLLMLTIRRMCFIFYEKNGFKFLYSTESLEKEANHIPEDEHLESRMMYLDLLGYIR